MTTPVGLLDKNQLLWNKRVCEDLAWLCTIALKYDDTSWIKDGVLDYQKELDKCLEVIAKIDAELKARGINDSR